MCQDACVWDRPAYEATPQHHVFSSSITGQSTSFTIRIADSQDHACGLTKAGDHQTDLVQVRSSGQL